MPRADEPLDFEDWCVHRSGHSEDFVLTWYGPGGRTCEVAWFGEPNGLLADVRDEGQRRGITVVTHQARYSLATLDAAADAVHRARGRLRDTGFELSSIGTAGFSADGFEEGLSLLGVDRRRPDDDDTAALADDLVAEVIGIVLGLDGVRGVIAPADVRVEPGRVIPA